MISRSTALTLALLSLHHTSVQAAAPGAGVYDNAANANALFSKAVPHNGNYVISSESTGRVLTYMHNDQPNIFPSADSVSSILNKIGGGGEAGTTFGLESADDGSTRIRFDDADKCLSAQWNFDLGMDTYGVAYECAVGSGAQSNTGLRDAKQWYLLVPVDGSSSGSGGSGSGSDSAPASQPQTVSKTSAGGDDSDDDSAKGNDGGDDSSSDDSDSGSSSDDSGSSSDDSTPPTSSGGSSGVACEKSPYWVWSHPVASHKDFYDVHPECVGLEQAPPCMHDYTWLHRHPDYLNEHPECQGTFDGNSKRALLHGSGSQRNNSHRRRASSSPAKRGPSGGRYYIILTDHIQDMQTRAVSAKQVSAFADAQSAWIDLFDKDNEDLIWTITSA